MLKIIKQTKVLFMYLFFLKTIFYRDHATATISNTLIRSQNRGFTEYTPSSTDLRGFWSDVIRRPTGEAGPLYKIVKTESKISIKILSLTLMDSEILKGNFGWVCNSYTR